MARGFNTTAVTESKKSFNSIATLVEVIVDSSDPAYMTDYARNISYDGKTWVATGIMSVSSVVETSTNTIETLTVSLSAIPDEYVKLFLDYNYIDRPVKLHKVFLDEAGAIVGNGRLLFDGRIDSATITHDIDSYTATAQITASSHWVDFSRKSGRNTNDSHQQSYFSGDSCFEFAIEYDREIKWGQE